MRGGPPELVRVLPTLGSKKATQKLSIRETLERFTSRTMARRLPSGDGMIQSRFWCLKLSALMTLPDVKIWRMALEPAEFRAATHRLRLSAAQSTPYRSAHPGTSMSQVLPFEMV